MSLEADFAGERKADHLSRYHVTARIGIETETTDVHLASRVEDAAYLHQQSATLSADGLGIEIADVQLAGRAEDAAHIHHQSVETIADELGVEITEYELLEIDEHRGMIPRD
ncbi:hypothetical protein [Halalkalicoccus subterraneus]|uniref:hypothetical protein n=1 Tax=Halalkalicoccus subterraneus TaxID=2675002 RepID=UPI000EFA9002|nr:hypothetical protein [Halalkalicoccus subterraneus]